MVIYMKIEVAFCSEPGGREYNEDSVRIVNQSGICSVVVADGLGGHGGGLLASSAAADTITESYGKNPQVDESTVRSLFTQANEDVIKLQSSSKKMKSTGVALFIKEKAAIWAHVGDSRLYYYLDGRLVTQTLDHSVSQMAVFSGEITLEQIRHHEDRNKVLKAFGAGEEITTEVSTELTLESGFHAFLLCTDGFWEYVLEAEMEIDLAKSVTPDDWIHSMCHRLKQRVPDNHDNYSAAAVFISDVD
jgi:serine/threonine protein phosphatase PrpC